MPETLDAEAFVARLRQAAQHVRGRTDWLSQLDSAVGDGDHGTTMARICDAILATLAGTPADDLAALCNAIGWAVMCTDGGSASPLLGSFFAGCADGLTPTQPLTTEVLHRTFAAGLQNLRRQTPAKPGDKTLLDALVPAVAALQQAAETGLPVVPALRAAATAAGAGAEATRPLRATFGRARNLGERTVGHLDPGAASIALFFEGFAL
jgi:phosphoenolpyruvate---glycerone phosphotransferase subunit DhaL